MASGARLSEEAGGVGDEFEVASTNRVSGELGGVSGVGEIGVASANQLVEDSGGVGGSNGVAPTYEVNGEAGTVGGEFEVDPADPVFEETGVARGLDGEIGVAFAKPVAKIEEGAGGGEIGVASVNQIIGESEVLGSEFRTDSVNYVTGEAEALGGEIALASENQMTEEPGASSGEIAVASANHVTEGAGASCGVIGSASVNRVTEEVEAFGDVIMATSSNQVTHEAEEACSELQVVSDTQLNVESAGRGGEIWQPSAIKLNEPGGGSSKIGMASAIEMSMEPGCGGGEVGLASEIQVNEETGAEVGEASANQVNGGTGVACGENGVASADQVNGETVSLGDEVGVASVIQVNDEAGSVDGEIGVPSANQVNGESEGKRGEIGLAHQVNGEPLGRSGDIGLASANRVNEEPGDRGGEILAGFTNQVNGVSGSVGGQLLVGEKHRWVDTKVYRRRPKGEKNKCVLSNFNTAPASKTFSYNGYGSQNDKIVEVSTYESHQNHNDDRVGGNRVVESEKIVHVPTSGDNAILKQIRLETVVEVISNKELSSAVMDSVTPIPVDSPVPDGALRHPCPASDSKVKINLASIAKLELRELKRKFENELYSVRKAVKKMDGGREEVVREFFHPVVNSSVVPNGARSNGFATRVYSGTRSLGHVPYKPNVRPFNQLRVSVIENGHSMVDSIEREKRTPKANQFYRNSEFLLANDKFPPAESNKKSKSNGKKSSAGEFGFGVGSKVYKSCSTLLEKLMKHKHGWVFNAPVDVKGLGLHDYFLIIKNPMDLGTVKAKLIKFWYKSPMEFAEDVRLTFHNAMLFNPKGHDVHIMAETLLKIFEGKWPDIEVKYLRELRMAVEPDMGYPTPTSRITNPFQSSALPHLETRVFNRSESMPHPVNPKPRTLTPAPSFRTPALKKPKAKDINKRDMTYDEKQKLSTNLQSLPPEKLDGVIQIIKKRSTALSQNDDEIEVDIDSVDTETLWELDRFVTNYKKSLSKNRRKAELANQMLGEARQVAEKITIPQPLPPKEATAGCVNATLSAPSHQNGPAANASGSSSSSSSSSSGSSSSDSDSDSSSEESDGGHSPGI